MDASRLVDALERFGAALPAIVEGLPDDELRWRPPSGAWSILEIVAHLADEEREDFRTRLELTLHDPTAPWPPIDPEGWAQQRGYREGSLAEALDRFTRERQHSVGWLRDLAAPDWSRRAVHPRFGAIRAGDLLVAWAAHDALHLRQIAKRLFNLAERDGGEYSSRYAGEWGS